MNALSDISLSAFPITKKWPAQHPDRIQLYSLPTPNGVKVSSCSKKPACLTRRTWSASTATTRCRQNFFPKPQPKSLQFSIQTGQAASRWGCSNPVRS